METIKISKLSENIFIRRLKAKDAENLVVIKSIERLLIDKRGYVFRMPPPGSKVILLVSGGIESTITWELLLKKYMLHVYPLFLKRRIGNHKKREEKAVRFFSKYFQNKYPHLFHPVHVYSVHLPPPELEKSLKNIIKYYHPLRILEKYEYSKNIVQGVDNSIFAFTYPLHGIAYSKYLWDHENIKISTIFSGVAPGDGDYTSGQTFTALRTSLLAACVATNNYDWQISSLAFEKETGHWLEKQDLIKLGAKMKLPLEYTWSCYNSGRFQCGNNCLTCHFRRICFNIAGVKDKTHYECDEAIYKIRRKIKTLIDLLLDKVFFFI